MMRLIVGTIHHGGFKWLATQLDFFKRTTKDYKLFVVADEKPPSEDVEWVRRTGTRHEDGVRALVQRFKNTEADYYLICDSDAFPVHPDWQDILNSGLTAWNSLFAAPIRTEFLDVFPHISFVYVARKGFHVFDIAQAWGAGQIIGPGHHDDLGCALPMRWCFHLMKSHGWTKHPHQHCIYFNCVYHAGGGSRYGGMYSKLYWDWSKLKQPNNVDVPSLQFINTLLGEARFK